jgi:hypothetical protein
MLKFLAVTFAVTNRHTRRAVFWALVMIMAFGLVMVGAFSASAAAPTPVPTTTVAEAQADPIWSETGVATVGAKVPARWMERDYWDVTHTYTTPGDIHMDISGRAQTIVGFRHELGGTKISSITVDRDGAVTAFVAASAAPVACPTPGVPCQGPGAGRAAGADFSINPVLWLAGQIAASATDFMSWAALNTNQDTKPDLTQPWWQDDYKRAFGVGVALWGFIFLINLARSAGWLGTRIDGEEWLRQTGIWTFAYFVGSMSGPLVGDLLIQGSAELTDNIIATWNSSTASETLGVIGNAITIMGDGGALGGAFLACLLLPFVLIGAVMVFVSLSLQTAMIYLSGAIVTVTFAWVVSHKGHDDAWKVPLLVAVLIFSKPALFFMLGVGFGLIRSIGDQSTPGGVLSVIIMGIFILIMASLSPTLMLRYIPIPGGDGHSVLPSLNPRRLWRR